ncbi:MAG: hypothetical protein JWO36_6682 [Myxococcales bacterium]|nr:hypothetical protein [Myxococcales bacterium]
MHVHRAHHVVRAANAGVVVNRVSAWLADRTPVQILAVGWLVFAAYAYPGLMSHDSFDQLDQARALLYSDEQPPAMAALWNVVDFVIAGPFGMLVLQSVTFVAGTYLVLGRVLRPRRAAVAAVGVLLFPPIFALMAVVWKDCLMSGLLALGLGLVLGDSRRQRIAGVAMVFAANLVCYHAVAATLPILVLLWWREPAAVGWSAHLRMSGRGLAVWLAVTAAASGANAALTQRPAAHWSGLSASRLVTHATQPSDLLAHAHVGLGYSWFQDHVGAILEWTSHTLLFRPLAYAAVTLLLLGAARRQRDVLALLLSGLAFEGSRHVIGPSADDGYSLWLVIATVIGIVMFTTRRGRVRSNHDSEP